MQCKEWDDANSELFKESHDEAVHKNPYKSRLYELISASQGSGKFSFSYAAAERIVGGGGVIKRPFEPYASYGTIIEKKKDRRGGRG